jgi:hypothetical protein
VDEMTEMQTLSQAQDFGRWGEPAPAQEFGRGFPQATPQQFGGRIPFAEQGWRSPSREVPPSTARPYLH